MSFTKKNIDERVFYVIDIGSYKLRAVSVRLKNKKLYIIDYAEKRQDTSYFINNECTNLLGLSENIDDLTRKLKNDSKEAEIIFNYPFGEIFTTSKTINYKRSSPNSFLKLNELEKIINSVEKLCLKKVEADLLDGYGRDISDLHIIISKIWHLKIDNLHHTKVLDRTWELLNIQLQNIFIPREKYESLIKICKSLGKKIYKVLPSEYCTPNIFSEPNVCCINIGANTMSISVKRDSEIVAISKVPFWIGNLIDRVHSHSWYARSQIIESLDNPNNFISEKAFFKNILQESIGIALSEILQWSICPHSFYISGGWTHNTFIMDAIKDIDFHKYSVKMTKKMAFLSEDMSEILQDIEHISLEHVGKIPIDIYGLLLETKGILQNEGDIVRSSLKNVLQKLWY